MFINQWVDGALRWTESDAASLGPETALWEFKSSRAKVEKLTEYVCPAASAFWNSGGGVLLLGVDSKGRIDGGLPLTIGNQSVRDRIDQALAQVQPPGPYEVHVIQREGNHSAIEEGHGVVVMAFDESTMAPHMAHDGKYYVRAGAHTDQAGHFLVEAIRARQGVGRPLLRCLTRANPVNDVAVDLVVVEVAGWPALDVSIRLDPTPPDLEAVVPSGFLVPVVDRNHPFEVILGDVFGAFQPVGYGLFTVELQYRDSLGRDYTYSQEMAVYRSLAPAPYGPSHLEEATRDLKKVTSYLRDMASAARAIQKHLRAQEKPRG